MSRIFDALRRSEQEQAGKNTIPVPDDGRRLQELISSLEKQSPGVPPPSPDLRPSPEQRLGDLDRAVICHVRSEEPIVAHSQNHLGAEKFRVLCHRLRQHRQTRTFRNLLVTSVVPKEGKTVVSLNLAITFACSSPRVLLVDTDMRGSGLRELLGLPALPGLAEVLEGRLELAAAFRKFEPFGLYCLPAGTPAGSPVELLQGGRMRELVAQITAAFDWIVFDSPPLNLFADAHCVAGLTDGVLLVVRSGWTPLEGVRQGLAALDGAYLAGVVLNGSSDPPHDRYYYHYYYPPSGADAAAAASPSSRTGAAAPAPAPHNGDGIGA